MAFNQLFYFPAMLGIGGTMENEEIHIGSCSDALGLLDELITDIKTGSLYYEGAEWFISRLKALRDAIERGIV